MGNILTLEFFEILLASTVRMATPLLFVGLAELYSERAGLVNIGLDGLMTIGACIGFIGSYISGNPFWGVLCGALAGIALNMIFAFTTITLCAGQTINGMAHSHADIKVRGNNTTITGQMSCARINGSVFQ